MIIQLLRFRYLTPLLSLKDSYPIKIAAAFTTWIITELTHLFSVDAELVLLLMVVMLLDWVTGILNAKRNKIPITSMGLRQTGIKVIEYFAILGSLSALSNVFGDTDIEGWVGELLRLVHDVDWLAYFYIIFTEIKSIAENIGGKKGKLLQFIEALSNKFFKDLNIKD